MANMIKSKKVSSKKTAKKKSVFNIRISDAKKTAEIRRDMVSREWVVVSSARQSRPIFGAKDKKASSKKVVKKICPFEDPQKSGNGDALFWLPRPKNGHARDIEKFENWFVQVIQNKYPIVFKDIDPICTYEGPYKKCDDFGFHEVVITRDHDKPLEKMTVEEILLVLLAYQQRYKVLEKDPRIEYVLIYHNQGVLAGASIPHPHSQIIALPVVPPDVARSINGALLFFEKNKKCVHCVMLDFELKEKKRIVYENEDYVAFCPYASKVPYEVRIFPKKHSSDFEETPEKSLVFLADALRDSLLRLKALFGDFDYNFFVHSSSARVDNVPYYHWHLEIYPKTYKWAGVELGTGIDVLSVPPEQSAEELRNILNKK